MTNRYGDSFKVLILLAHPDGFEPLILRRKVSGGTRSDVGRACRDTFLGLAKTCAKLGIAFWDYLGARLDIPGSPAIPYLPELVAAQCRPP
jgi:hypothetical protein